MTAPRAHIHSPRATVIHARSDGHCKAIARDGRKCGSYRRLDWFVPWYGWYFACYHCGALHGEGESLGRFDVRDRWHQRRAEQDAERKAFDAKYVDDIELPGAGS